MMTKMLLPYIHLARLEKPVGIWLVFLPALMGLTLSQGSDVVFQDVIIFFFGSLFIRSAGCVINDIADKDFDKQVSRTKSRPLASGTLTLKQAYIFLCILLFCALILVPFVNPKAWILIPIVLGLAATYPLFKRFTFIPQVYLGFCMNISLVFAYVHAASTITMEAILIYASLVFWTVAYDTIYGHCDKVDDIQAGVKSLALHPFGKTKGFLYASYSACFSLFGFSAGINNVSQLSFYILILSYIWCMWRVFRLDTNNPVQCLHSFKADVYTGLMLWISLVLI